MLGRSYDPSSRALNVEQANRDLAQLRELEALLNNQTSETIDDFIVENPSFATVTKILIAASLFVGCFRPDDRHRVVVIDHSVREPVSSLTRTKSRNWIHLLINIIRHGIRMGSVTKKNKVKIVTFNYDTILEYVLEKQFSNTESKYGPYQDFVEIVHPHGQVGQIGNVPSHLPSLVNEWASGIHVVNEDVASSEVLDARKRARRVVRNSKNIYAAGFAFAGPNCRMLSLNEVASGSYTNRRLHVLNYDGNIGVSRSVQLYRNPQIAGKARLHNAPEPEITEGSFDRPIGVADWIRIGALGELPG